MRIFYDHQVFSLQNAGGAARYHYELIAHLQNRFHVQIDLMMGLNRTVFPFQDLKGPNTTVVGVRTNLEPGVRRYLLNDLMSNAFVLSQSTYDIYHPTLYRAMPFVRRRRMVVTHYDCIHERFPEMFRNASRVIKGKRKLYAAANAIICISESSRRDLIEYYGVNPSIASVVHLGFKPLLSTREVLLSDAALERPYLLFVGFRQNYKNFSTLLLAFAHSGLSANCDLLTVGGGPLSSEELLHAKSLGVAACLKNVRDVNDAALASIYARASLLVYPSLYEGFGLPPLEAMSMGCPVLASSTSSMPEVCGEAAEYFNPEDAGELSRVMVEVLNNPQSLAEMRARGYERVERFDWNVTAAKTYAIYSDVLRH